MASELTKREAQAIARRYAAEQLATQDEPAWPVDAGLIDAGDHAARMEFMDELQRIAVRIDRSITPSGRLALEAKTP